MIETTFTSNRLTIALTFLCTALLIYIMVALVILREQVFEYHGSIDTAGELIIFLGFMLVLAFNITTVTFYILRIRYPDTNAAQNYFMLGFGALCIIFMLGEKTMVDEIARESQIGWKVNGEWIILYVLLALQLCYNLLVLRQLWRVCHRNAT